uniref:Uncharacterized protein n=1 Tax=Tanacetum cinerariifolium TaxID=118510 RepID=A0A699GXF9_TANCI|nr:hypothetical protein [Tanacetum cinerariifolium]
MDGFHLQIMQSKQTTIKYPRFTKLIIDDLRERYPFILKRLNEPCHSVKDDTVLSHMYTTREVTEQAMEILDDLLTDEIKQTHAYKDYVMDFKGVRVSTIQPEVVESTQGTIKTPSATRTPNPEIDKKRKRGNKVWGNLLHLRNVVKKEREQLKAEVHALISQEFAAHAPKIIKEIFRIHMQNTVLIVHPNSSASTASILDLQQLYLKMKSDLQSQDHDDHPDNDALHEGEKSAKMKKTSRGSKNRQKDLITSKKDTLVSYGPQRNKNDPWYLYNTNLFYLKNENKEEKKYVLSLHKIHATSFPLGIKSYQMKVNLTAPTLTVHGIDELNPYTIIDVLFYYSILEHQGGKEDYGCWKRS